MYCVRKVTEDLWWVGGNDRRTHLFENIHPIPRGVSYNAYVLLDEQTVLFDGVDWSAARQLVENVEHVLGGRELDYLVLHHLEPDHGAGVREITLRWPKVKLVAGDVAFRFLDQFGFACPGTERLTVKEGSQLSFGKHSLTFCAAPLVHWPDVLMSFDTADGTLFSADAFGTFGALDGKLFNDEVDFPHDWLPEARRYYTNIVGKFGPQVQAVLKKAQSLDIRRICPLHGPVWRSDLGWFIGKYDKWSRYEPEDRAVLLACGSMYGNTESAADALAAALAERGVDVTVRDVSTTPVSQLIGEAFRCSHIVLASPTYNMDFFPPMHAFLSDMKALNLQKRTFALISNGTWAPGKAGDLLAGFVTGELKECALLEPRVAVKSAPTAQQAGEIAALADAIAADVKG